jgi:HK97 family phage major capsid protein
VKIDEARAKSAEWAGKEMPKEVATQIDAILAAADEIKLQIQRQERIESGEAFLNEPNKPKAAFLGMRPAGPDEGNEPIDPQAWREFKISIIGSRGLIEKRFRFHIPLVVQRKGYPAAFEAYLRKGLHEMGPNDRKALSESTDAAGGYLVPEDFHTELLKKVATIATVRMYARVIGTSRDIAKWPRVKYTTNNEYTSGMRLTWTGETPSSATVHRVTDQVFGEIAIPINTAMASQLQSADMIEDSAFDVLGISSDLLAEAFGLGENAEFWTGSGAGKPRGIITDASDTTNFDAAVTTAATADTIAADDVIDVCYALPAQYERNARWFMTKGTEKLVRKLQDTDGAYLWPIIAQVGGLGAAPDDLLGFPRTRDEFVDEISDGTTTTTYPMVFGDLSGYIIADRVGLSIKRDENLYAETNQVLLLGRKRVGGQLAEAYRLSLLKTVHST